MKDEFQSMAENPKIDDNSSDNNEEYADMAHDEKLMARGQIDMSSHD